MSKFKVGELVEYNKECAMTFEQYEKAAKSGSIEFIKTPRKIDNLCASSDTTIYHIGGFKYREAMLKKTICEQHIYACTKCGEPMKVEAVGDKPKYKVGDKVKVVGNGCWHKYKNGDILTLAKSENNDCHAYENATTWRVQEGDSYIAEQDIEPYTEPAPEPKREPVVLYCVKSWSGLCQKDKVYAASADGHLIFDNGQRSCFEVNHERFKHEWKDQLIECVKRPAKVGEWVLVTNASTYIENKYKNGDIVQVKVGKDGAVRFGDCGTWSSMGLSEYLVLDGYQPEPEKCKCCGQIITGEAQS